MERRKSPSLKMSGTEKVGNALGIIGLIALPALIGFAIAVTVNNRRK